MADPRAMHNAMVNALLSIASDVVSQRNPGKATSTAQVIKLNPFAYANIRAFVFSPDIDPLIREAFEDLEKRFSKDQEPSSFGALRNTSK